LLITWCRNHGRLCSEVLAHRPDPDDASAQTDLIGVPWMIISQEPSAVPNGGSRTAAAVSDRGAM
jgi:hypothetical protein